MNNESDFFVAGGTLRTSAPSYVTRSADAELLQQLQAGEFCYVLTPRQMGKSSLMVRTAQRLRTEGMRVVIIDLTSIGASSSAISADQWYLGLLSRMRSDLRLATDVQAWWQAHSAFSVAQRFTDFLQQVVLTECAEKVVILIDEIDSTLSLPFRDDFFAAIRAVYNERANNPNYNRLTFALFGVATPTDLIQDRERTPFNVGHRIDLREFTLADAEPLRQGLTNQLPEQANAIFQRIFYWTNGHPYLTQKLCQAVVLYTTIWQEEKVEQTVDQLVYTTFLSEEGRKDPNLTFVQDRILTSPEREQHQMLRLYRRVRSGERVADDDRSLIQNRLELYGLVGVVRGILQVRNRIYEQVFTSDWVDSVMPVNRQRRIAVIAATFAFVLLVGVVTILTLTPNPTCDELSTIFTQNANDSSSRLGSLDSLLQQGDACRTTVFDLFYSIDAQEQIALFEGIDDPQNERNRLKNLIGTIYLTLDTEPAHDQELMKRWSAVLKNAGLTDEDPLVLSINYWQTGRWAFQQGNIQDAIDAYESAINVLENENHLVLHYDLALAYIELAEYDKALTHLDTILQAAETLPVPPTPTVIPARTSPLLINNTREMGRENPRALIESSRDLRRIATSTSPANTNVFTQTPLISNRSINAVTPEIGTRGQKQVIYQQRFRNADVTKVTVQALFQENVTLSRILLVRLDDYKYLAELNVSNPLLPEVIAFSTSTPSPTLTTSPLCPDRMVLIDTGASAFCLDQTEVTNADYNACVTSAICEPLPSVEAFILPTLSYDLYTSDATYADYPVLNVTVDQAIHYCEQYVGVFQKRLNTRLPTFNEWQLAYHQSNPTPVSTEGPLSVTAPSIYSKANNSFGLAGNVQEWVLTPGLLWQAVPVGDNFLGSDFPKEATFLSDYRSVRPNEANVTRYLEVGFRCATSIITVTSTIANIHPTSERGIYVAGTIAYVADKERGLRIFDVSDPNNPHQLNQQPIAIGAQEVHVVNRYAYIVDGQSLRIIDVSDPSNPLAIPNSVYSPGWAWDIYVEDAFAYVASWRNDVHIVNISDPQDLIGIGTLGVADRAVGIAVRENIAFVVDNRDKGLRIYDVTSPEAAVQIGFSVIGGTHEKVYVERDRAYLASGMGGIHIIDISTPSQPIRIGGYDTPGYARDIYVEGDFAYVADQEGGVRVLYIADQANPIEIEWYETPGNAQGVWANNGVIYVADSVNGLTIINREPLIRETPIPNTDFQDSIFQPSPYIYRIIAEGCRHEPNTRSQTGFVIQGKPGIISNLGSLLGCNVISAVSDNLENSFEDLQIVEVDIDRDIAVLSSDEINNTLRNGLEITDRDIIEYENLLVVGYPLGIRSQLSSLVRFSRRVLLGNILPPTFIEKLARRDSPALDIDVVAIEGVIQPGYSGAPVLATGTQVVGIMNGYLREGDFSWFIPITDIVWVSVSQEDVIKRLQDIESTLDSILF